MSSRPAQTPVGSVKLSKRIASLFVRVAIVAMVVAGSIGGHNQRYLLGQASDLEHRQR